MPRGCREATRADTSRRGNEIGLAEALEHQEDRRPLPGIRHEMRPARPHRVRLAAAEANLLFRIPQADAYAALQHVERVLPQAHDPTKGV